MLKKLAEATTVIIGVLLFFAAVAGIFTAFWILRLVVAGLLVIGAVAGVVGFLVWLVIKSFSKK